MPGVIDVVGFGGDTKQYHVEVDPYPPARATALTLDAAHGAIANANQNVGGQRLTLGEQSFNVRGVGLIRSLRDIGDIVGREQQRHAGARARHRERRRRRTRRGSASSGKRRRSRHRAGHRADALRRRDAARRSRACTSASSYIRTNHLLPPGMEIEPVLRSRASW